MITNFYDFKINTKSITTKMPLPGFVCCSFGGFRASCFQQHRNSAHRNAYVPLAPRHCRVADSHCRRVRVSSCIDRSELPPGTTSLVVRVGSDFMEVKGWLRNWLHDTVFAAADRGTSVGQSVGISPQGAMLRFHAADGAIRGMLTFTVTRARRDEKSTGRSLGQTEMRVTSTSRFLGAVGGGYTATLPGERRLLRCLVSEIDRVFLTMSVVYKAPNIRLRQLSNGPSLSAGYNVKPVTMLVAELRDSTTLVVMVDLLREWAYGLQYGIGEIRLFDKARLPPLSVKSITNGVAILFPVNDRIESKFIPHLFATARNRRIGNSSATIAEDSFQELAGVTDDSGDTSRRYKLLVLVTATYPSRGATNIIVSR